MNPLDAEPPEKMQFNQDQVVFLRTMGHELRTPLNSIVATCEMMANAVYGDLQPGQQKAFQRILRNGNRLVKLINEVMLYIRAQANALELNSRPLPLKQLLTEQVSQLRERAGAKHLTIDVVIEPETVETVLGDPDQITFIINEILVNAISFSTCGNIRVQMSNAEPGRWKFTVSDTGIGIEQENLAQAFAPFWRGKDAKQYAQDGNGLGLAIIREFIRIMGGTIDLQSHIGKGTVVTIILPNVIPAQNDSTLEQNPLKSNAADIK
jgi:two-component system sensor histidine kinase/response regulator